MNFGFWQTTCSCTINGIVKVGDEKEIKSFITRQLQYGKVTTKEIVKTLRTYDTTKICKLYKRIFGEVPTEKRGTENWSITCLDGGKVYDWAKDFATSRKMDRCLYGSLSRAAHHWGYSSYDMDAVYSKHGYYAPTLKQHIVDELLKNCADPTSNYAKRPMYGHTHLYFCSPVYGHADYNKWRAIPIKGNERFCELVVKYADRFFKD